MHLILCTHAHMHRVLMCPCTHACVQGLLQIMPQQCPDPRTTLTRLWVHENSRVFHDRCVGARG